MGTRRLLAFGTLMTLAASVVTFAPGAPAGAAVPGQVVITEWMYNPTTASSSEFVEITNIGGEAVPMTNYSFDDDSRAVGTVPLASLGTLAPGESALIAETTADAFRADWGLDPAVKVFPSNATNLGRADEINIFNGNVLADRLTYGDERFPGTIRTVGKSGAPTTCLALGANNVGLWQLAQAGDALGSRAALSGDVGSPGTTTLGACAPVNIVGGDGTGNTNTLPCNPESASGTGPAPAGAQPWPGSASVTVADQACAWKTTTGPEGRDMSGLVFDPTNPGVLWAVKNKSWVFRLVKQGDLWVSDTADGWGAGKQIFFPGGVGQPDSEGLTIGADGALYITTERDNANNSIALNSVLRYDPTAPGTTLVPTTQWDLTADFPELNVPGKSNLGFEGATFVPDSSLVRDGFVDQSTGAAYNPASYPGHGFGLFFTALENDGKLYAYALGADGSHHRVAVVDTGMGHVMDVQYDRDLDRIWALCDNTCAVSSTLLKIDQTGSYVSDVVYAAPAGLPNVNIEGFAIAPDSTCTDGHKEVVWSDDGLSGVGHEGHALYSGTFPCGVGPTVTLSLLGTNDFHGRIDTNTVNYAGTVEQLRAAAGEDNTLFIGAGDLIGASLFASAIAQDQPTIDVLNTLDLDVSSVGNHEFDQGFADLTNRVIGDPRNAQWDYLGANVYQADGVTPALPEYALFERDGVTIGVIGAVTQETPALVSPDGVAGLVFGNPVDAVNRVAGQLHDGDASNGEADVIVAAYHEGAPTGDPATIESQVATSPVFASIVNGTSPLVNAIFTGHTHVPYAWEGPVPGAPGVTRPIVQTGAFGDRIEQVTLTVDTATGAVKAHTQRLVARTTTPAASLIATYPRVAAVNGIVTAALAAADAVGGQVVGNAHDDITTAYTGGTYQGGVFVGPNPANPAQGRDDRASESTLGNLVADALLDALSPTERGGAEIGVVNPGGLRAELFAGEITYAEANSVLPFVNNLWTTTLTGAQVKTMLEQQWQRDASGNVPSRPYLQLGLSKNVSYTYDPTLPEGSRITSITVNGAPIDPAAGYRIGTFSFLTAGGDNFRVVAGGTDARDSGLVDRDAWIAYIGTHSPLLPDFARRSAVVSGAPSSVQAGAHAVFDVSKLDLTSLGAPQNTSLEVQLNGSSLGVVPVTGGAAHIDVTVPITTAPGATSLTLVAMPSGTVVHVPLTVTAFSGALRIVTTSLPGAKVGTAYAQSIVAVGGTAPLEFSVSRGLPDGLALDSASGAITGTPTTPGPATFRVTVRDASRPRQVVQQNLTLSVAPDAIVVTPGTAPSTVVGASYQLSLAASGGAKPYSWSVVEGALPSGLLLKPAGAITGRATTSGSSSFTIRATDKFGNTGDIAMSIDVAPALQVLTTSVPNGTVGVAYSQAVTASNGTAPYTFGVTGALPPGVGFDAVTGTFAGTPTSPGRYNVTVIVRDATKPVATVRQKLTIQIAPAAIVIAPTTLTDALLNRNYRVALSATGGSNPYGWSLVAGTLPTGVVLSANGVISGKPVAALGTLSFTVRATDKFGYTADAALSISVT